jgi:choline dehydrogenase-like flavoprotein
VLANRLTAGRGAGKKVLVLEAGSEKCDDMMVQMPAGVLRLFQSDRDWHYTSENESGAKDRGMYLCRGKVLGGSSALNVLLYTRGDKHDYDIWESEFGCVGWKGCDVVPYFKKTEDDLTGSAEKSPEHHATGGEWAVEHCRYQNPLSAMYLEACKQANLPVNEDFNNWSVSQEGAGRFPLSTRNGVRCHAATALLTPALADPARKLKVLTGALVHKIEIEEHCVMGVRFEKDGQSQFARLAQEGEVLLAGGAINSPHLLMLSGIGPAKHLKQHGIEVIKDLPGVGENLQDHPAAVVSFQCPEEKKGISVSSKLKIKGTKIPHPGPALEWKMHKTGPLCSTGCDHGGFFRTSAAPKNSPSCDLQMRFLAARAVTADGMNSFTTFKNTKNHPDGFSFQSIAVRPQSRGRVTLAGSDPRLKPIVETGFVTNKNDLATMREGLRLGRKIAQQPAFQEYLGPEIFPGAHVQTDNELDAYISESVHTANAIVGTCRMGQITDKAAVCDPEMRVLGVHGLRVCDSSVMPKLPGGQSGSCTVMIAERAADFILA